ncbi:TMhelix containing protein [Vibrio phage 1.016.O._10N.286.46.A11]|nr:TMhelix containing protein [Vibrio phage 1.016.O._10N.286.46.A11]
MEYHRQSPSAAHCIAEPAVVAVASLAVAAAVVVDIVAVAVVEPAVVAVASLAVAAAVVVDIVAVAVVEPAVVVVADCHLDFQTYRQASSFRKL